MDKKYLIPIKNGFLVYQPESDTVYRGKRKTAELKHILIIPFLTAIFTPVFNFIAIYIWPFIYFTRYRVTIYTTLMVILGVIYYKFIYAKSKEKLLKSQLEPVNFTDLKEHYSQENMRATILGVLLIVVLFLLCLYDLIHIGLFDKILYSGAVIIYTALLPILTIEVEFKGRFLLIKRLSKLNKAEK